MVRKGSIRIPADIAVRVRAGHPWVFRDALGGRDPHEPAGAVLEVIDPTGAFVARALYDPEGPIALRIFTRRREETLGAAYIEGRVAAARQRRERLLDLSRLSAFRVFAGESEGMPGVAVDCFGDYLVAQIITPAALHFRDPLYDALIKVWKPRGLYEQLRTKPLTGDAPRGPATLARGENAPVDVEVREGDAKFLVDPTAPQNVGLFPDLREGRSLVQKLASGRRVLNLFSFTGAFSVHAALGGAREVVSIDLAAKGHARARQNMQLSGVDPEAGREYYAEDAFKMLTKFQSRARKFDLAIVDPPTFSQAKGRVFTALKDWAELAQSVFDVLDPGGLMLACSNAVKLDAADLERALGEGAARAGTRAVVVARIGLPADFPVALGFPEGHYLKCVLVSRE
jgi:23S rRNA (cytosine1962-C5)-methyltransferase